jgi:hypothetical protein
MHRLLAWVLVPVVAAASGAPLLHTHAYGDHHHPAHQHGLALHDHDRPSHHDDHHDDGTVRVERCDPGEHAVSPAFIAGTPAPFHTVDAVIESISASPRPQDVEMVVRPSEVRAHGPPARHYSALRAPPSIALA